MLLVAESPRLFTTPDANTAGVPVNTPVRESKAQRHIQAKRRERVPAGVTAAFGNYTETGVYVPIGTVQILIDTSLNGASERTAVLSWVDVAGTSNSLPYARAAANETFELGWRNSRSAIADTSSRKCRAINIQNDGGVDFEVEVTLGFPTAPA